MRVIAGKYKGRALIAPKKGARPTLDRMKETLFNILNFKLPSSSVLDLFAGSGQLAIESLSRGALRAVICDCDRDAVETVKFNLSKVGAQADVRCCDYKTCLANLPFKMDVVFVDPPYASGLYVDVLTRIDQFDLLAENGVAVCEHLATDELPASVGNLYVCDSRKMGTVRFDFYKRREQCE